MKLIKFDRKFNIFLLTILFIVSVIYSFVLANKRYVNFEYGKFDLGNMAQMVWNTSQGRFMEVTDQFGTNMPRWGMSHIDPILAIFAPIYWVYPHPMLLVIIQQAFILSAIYPLFVLTKWKTKSIWVGFLVVLTYVLYPANGFTLVWTGFHGISFVAPLLIWLVWYLERYDFLVNATIKQKAIYWVLIFFMLMGKEEIGAILGLASIFLYFKNKKLAIYTAVISFTWTLLCFLVFIPAYSHYRSDSVNTLLSKIEVTTSGSENVSGDNFFITRYAYLGSSYGEIIKNIFLRPDLIVKETFTEEKAESLNNLFGPLGYFVVVSPIWLISVPDLAIVLLSQDEIFQISNHRIAFVIVSLFLSLVYLLGFLRSLIIKYIPQFKYANVLILVLSLTIFATTVWFSHKTDNPLYVSGRSFIENKLLSKVMAQEYTPGDLDDGHIPRNDQACLEEMHELIEQYNPEIYTGPDYLGAHSSLRRVNALFPSRFWDANMVIADIYESKTLGVFGDTGWLFNKGAVLDMISLNRYDHIYSCGNMSAFVEKDADSNYAADSSVIVSENELQQFPIYEVKTSRITTNFRVVDLPEIISKENPTPIVTAVGFTEGDAKDKMTYFKFVSSDMPEKEFPFINYAGVAFPESLSYIEQKQYIKETYHPRLRNLEPGTYDVFWGIGDLVRAAEVFIGRIEITD